MKLMRSKVELTGDNYDRLSFCFACKEGSGNGADGLVLSLLHFAAVITLLTTTPNSVRDALKNESLGLVHSRNNNLVIKEVSITNLFVNQEPISNSSRSVSTRLKGAVLRDSFTKTLASSCPDGGLSIRLRFEYLGVFSLWFLRRIVDFLVQYQLLVQLRTLQIQTKKLAQNLRQNIPG